MRTTRLVAALIALILLAPGWAPAASVYVKSLKAKILQAPRFDAPTVAEADRGQELALKEKTERWFKVAVAGKEGWVPELLVSDEPPKGKSSVLESAEEDISGKARRRASAIATAGASRGLTEEGIKEMSKEDPKADFRALSKVEAAVADPDKAIDFITSGINKAKGGGK